MNIREYISSGVLELYVLGALDQTEAQEVEMHVKQYPEIKEELDSIQFTLESYAEKHAVQASPIVKKKLFAEIERRAAVEKISEPVTRSLPATTKYFNWLSAASIIVALFSTALSAYFYNQWKNSEGQLISLREENKIFAQNANYMLDSNKHIIEQKTTYFSFVTDTSTSRIAMKGLPIAPTASALVFWNKQSKEVFIDIKNLPKPPDGMQYQLWALDNGVPIDAGVFEMASTGTMQKMKSITSAQAFAVTLEKTGGSPQPNLEMLHVIGTI